MKLQAKLLAGIVPAMALGVLAIAWMVYTQLRASSEAELLRQMELVVGQTRQETDAFVATAAANARLFAGSAVVERYVRIEDEEQRFELMQPAVLELFASYRDAYPTYKQVQLLLPDGYEDTRVGRPGSRNLSEEEGDSPFFLAMAESGAPVHSQFLADPDDGRPVFKFGRAIMLGDRRADPAFDVRKLHGYLIVTAEAPFLERQVRTERIGRSGYLFAMDAAGTIVEHPNEPLVGSQVANAAELLRLADRTHAGDSAPPRLHSMRFGGRDATLQATWLHDGLLLVAVLPERELRAVSRKLAWTVALVTLATICAATVFLWGLLRALVLVPLGALQRTAVAIGDGDFDRLPKDVPRRDDEIGALELAFRDMSDKLSGSMAELQGSYERIHELAFKDSLTGLANRRQFLETLEAVIADPADGEGRLAVLFLDLDDFKKVNDLMGHDVGDELLLVVARRLCDCLREPVCIARLGGDEFVALVRAPDGAAAMIVAQRLLDRITRPIALHGQDFRVGSSIGVSLYPEHGSDAAALVKCADTAMYAVKRERKNGAGLYRPELQAHVERQARLENDLRAALERAELRLVYQPQVNAATDRVVGLEALLRWHHPEIGFISPADFIPMAEATGLVASLGAWVIDEACRQLRRWSDDGLDPVRVAVNVSPRQFALQDVAATVTTALERHGVRPRDFEVELTESCMMEAPAEVVDALRGLQQHGVRVAMDDFGTGHSSLATLATLPIDTLKIDRGFVTDVDAHRDKASILSAVLRLANDLGLETVAEGVETAPERAFLEAHGCDLLQGYLVARPMEREAATAWLDAHARTRRSRAA